MLALTVRQPWAYAITDLGKRIENRVWQTSYRGDLVIHSGSSVDQLAVMQLRHQGFVIPDAELVTSALIAIVSLDDITRDEDGDLPPWAFSDENHWRLSGVRKLSGKIVVAGQQKLWKLPPLVEELLSKEL